MKTMQPHQIAAKKQIQNHLAEAQKHLAAVEKLSGENHIFNFFSTGRLNDAVNMTEYLLVKLSEAEDAIA